MTDTKVYFGKEKVITKMKNKKNILKHSVNDKSFPRIVPSKSKIPSWFKDTRVFENDLEFKKRLPYPVSFKACSSFTDCFISGYLIPLTVDIYVEQSDNGPIISWNDQKETFLHVRDPKLNPKIPTPAGYSSVHFAWNTKHVYKIPKGYSALVCHPLNRFDLPFLTLSGIIDGEFSVYPGNVPVFFSNTFEGLISAGTPIAQIILFKTENWTSEEDDSILEEAKMNEKKILNKAIGWYKEFIWKKKVYE